MTNSKRLKPIRDIKHHVERTEAMKVGRQQQRLSDAQQKLSELERYRDEYHNGIDLNRVSADYFEGYERFLSGLNDAIAQQVRLVDQCEERLQNQIAQWQQVNGQYKAVEKYIERLEEQEHYVERKREQSESDDMVQSRWNRPQH